MSLAIKPSSTPSGSVSRPSAGPSRALARPSRPTAGPGWCWPATPSCAWPASSLATSGCRGSGPDPSHDGHPTGCGAGFRGCCAHWARQPVRRNPPDAPQAGPGAAARDLPCVTRQSRSQPPSPGRSRATPRKPPDLTAISTKQPSPRSAANSARPPVKSQAQGSSPTARRVTPLLVRMKLQRPGVCPASARQGSRGTGIW